VDPGGDLKTAGSFQVPETDDELVGAGDSRRCQWCRSRRITRVHETAVSAVVGDDVWLGGGRVCGLSLPAAWVAIVWGLEQNNTNLQLQLQLQLL
jgi:hypothetical protein